MKPLYRRLLVLLGVILAFTLIYVIYRFVAASRVHVPPAFTDARTKGAQIAEQIVANSNEVAFDIGHLNENAPSYGQVSSTIGGILQKVADIRSQATDLDGQLGIMTQSLADVQPPEARDAALKSISQRLALVSNLITYTDEVSRLMDLIRAHLKDHAQNTQDINRMVNEINAEVTAINNFNRAANESMLTFDSMLR